MSVDEASMYDFTMLRSEEIDTPWPNTSFGMGTNYAFYMSFTTIFFIFLIFLGHACPLKPQAIDIVRDQYLKIGLSCIESG